MHDPIHAVDGPGPEFYQRLNAAEAAVADLLARASFQPGLDESLAFVAGDLVAIIHGGVGTEEVAQRLQAFAAPPSSYIPPLEDFLPLAREVVTLMSSPAYRLPDAV